MRRREFLQTTALAAVGADALAQVDQPPVIDTHVHLYDPTRPQGVPWPPKTNTLIYKKTLPERLRQAIGGLPVVGAIKVEASPWLEDNQWVLDTIEKEPFMVGTVGNLEPGKPGFSKNLDRFGKNPLFLGIRCGYLWDRNLSDEMLSGQFVADLKEFAARGLALDLANPSVRILRDVLRLADAVPDLRMVLDHLPKLEVPERTAERPNYEASLRAVGSRPQVYVKLSAVLREIDGKIPDDHPSYAAKLDELYETFGPDRVLYGSDWPNSEPLGRYPKVFGVVQRYFARKSPEQREKFYWRNSVAAYRWKQRDPSQPKGA